MLTLTHPRRSQVKAVCDSDVAAALSSSESQHHRDALELASLRGQLRSAEQDLAAQRKRADEAQQSAMQQVGGRRRCIVTLLAIWWMRRSCRLLQQLHSKPHCLSICFITSHRQVRASQCLRRLDDATIQQLTTSHPALARPQESVLSSLRQQVSSLEGAARAKAALEARLASLEETLASHERSAGSLRDVIARGEADHKGEIAALRAELQARPDALPPLCAGSPAVLDAAAEMLRAGLYLAKPASSSKRGAVCHRPFCSRLADAHNIFIGTSQDREAQLADAERRFQELEKLLHRIMARSASTH